MQENQNFAGKASSYQKGRPSYSDQLKSVLHTLVFPHTAHPRAADIGCGTGIFSRLLIDCAYHVYGIEPDTSMLSLATEELDSKLFTPISGTAEDIPLSDNSVDLVSCAQSFHWFDSVSFRAECDRILRPNGKILLIWNTKDTDSPIMRDYQEICTRILGTRFSGFHNGLNLSGKEVLSFFHSHEHTLTFSNDQFVSMEKFLLGVFLPLIPLKKATHAIFTFWMNAKSCLSATVFLTKSCFPATPLFISEIKKAAPIGAAFLLVFQNHLVHVDIVASRFVPTEIGLHC